LSASTSSASRSQFPEDPGYLSCHCGGYACSVGAQPDDALRPGGDERLGAGEQNPRPVRAERGKDDGTAVDDRADARRIVHVTRPLVQGGRVGEGDPFGIARNGGDGVPALQCLSGDCESGAAGGAEDGQVHVETLEGRGNCHQV
jgi:hypothetical protein